jgi:hypothetical protein
MLTQRGYRNAALLVAAVVMGFAAQAQSTTAPCTVGMQMYFGYGVSQKTGAPYSATVKTTFEQKLPDGNTIRSTTVTHQYRDSSGKTRSEMGRECSLGEDGLPHLRVNVNVYDPATKTTMSWETGGAPFTKVVHVSQPGDYPQHTLTPEEIAEQQKWYKLQQHGANEYKRESLGSKTIAGVTAEGSRTTRTIPPGGAGNDLPLVTVQEHWLSKQSNVQMMESNDDPRRGKTTTEVVELSQGEPDAALFAPPAGYTVEEQKSTVVVVASKGTQ